MKKLMFLFFAAVLVTTACNKPDPEKEWLEYLQRYKWEFEYSLDHNTGYKNPGPLPITWEFYETYLTYYVTDSEDDIPYKCTVIYDIEEMAIKDITGNVSYIVDVSKDRLVLLEQQGSLHFKKGRRK